MEIMHIAWVLITLLMDSHPKIEPVPQSKLVVERQEANEQMIVTYSVGEERRRKRVGGPYWYLEYNLPYEVERPVIYCEIPCYIPVKIPAYHIYFDTRYAVFNKQRKLINCLLPGIPDDRVKHDIGYRLRFNQTAGRIENIQGALTPSAVRNIA